MSEQPTTKPRRSFRLRPLDHIVIASLLIGLVALLLWPMIFVTIGSGRVGVLFRLFGDGTATEFVFEEGVAVKWPWDGIEIYDTRIQKREFTTKVLTGNGLLISVDCAVLFKPIADQVGFLHKEIGPDYIDRIVVPSAIEAVRKIVGQYDPHDIYTTDTFRLAEDINEELRESTKNLRVDFEDLLIRQVLLPKEVHDAINNKLTQEQLAEAYVYRLQQAVREAERRRIEAVGIQTFYAIVANALSPQLLTWRGIEATVELADSPNTKIVIVGSGEDQMPLILGSEITKQPDIPPPEPVDPTAFPLPDFTNLPKLFPDLPHPNQPWDADELFGEKSEAQPQAR